MTGARFYSLLRLPYSSIWSTLFAVLQTGETYANSPAAKGKRPCQVSDFSFLFHSSP
jgi:hypothetical protein